MKEVLIALGILLAVLVTALAWRLVYQASDQRYRPKPPTTKDSK
jgi:hypothetical protein